MEPNVKNKIIVVDDEIAIAGLIQHVASDLGYKVQTFSDSQFACKEIIKQQPFLVITDLSMPKMDGIELLMECKKSTPSTDFIIMTGYATIETAVEAMNRGALNYIQKPMNLDHLRHLINQAGEEANLIKENKNLHKRLHNQDILSTIVGTSPQINKVHDLIQKVAPSDANILITGESGTGKELVAKAIHYISDRKAEELVSIDCVALPPNLFESELFGYEKGAFTGAEHQRKGLMEMANNGTFFMDEITELDYNLQAKLLRVLQERQFRRVGGNKIIDVDIRVIAATRRDPLQAVEEGLFREDLFYRLNVIPIHLPPLRERQEDIPQLIEHFLQLEAAKNKRGKCQVSAKAMEYLLSYSWPGNIRELRNIILRTSILCTDNEINVEDLPLNINQQQKLQELDLSWSLHLPFKDAKEMMIEKFEQEYLLQQLKLCSGNITAAALESGVNRKTLHRLINKYNLTIHNEAS